MFNLFKKRRNKELCYNCKGDVRLVYTKYGIEIGTSSFNASYIGNTIEELHNAIDNDKRLDTDEGMRRILKEGYFGEFLEGNYITKDYVIDNCMHFMWTVR